MGRQVCAMRLTAALGVALAIGCDASNSVRSPAPTTPAAAASGSGAEVAAKEEQAAIEAAKRNPIATPEPRPLLPAKQPPPRPERGLPEQAPPPRAPSTPTQSPQPAVPYSDAAPSAAKATPEYRVVAPEQPPAPPFEQPPPPPMREYIWAPGYWYWYHDHYVWIGGVWMPPQRGYVYLGAHWVHAQDGFVFMPGGWAIAGGTVVTYPVYRHRYLYEYPDWRHRSRAWPAERRGYRSTPRGTFRPRGGSTPRGYGGRSANRTRSCPRGR